MVSVLFIQRKIIIVTLKQLCFAISDLRGLGKWFKRSVPARHWWFTPVILAPQEANYQEDRGSKPALGK
jgi:hypothetical protein